MRILLLGGSGRLGTAMQRAWSGGHEIIAPGRDEIQWKKEGIASLIAQTNPEMIVNTTAYNNVDAAEGEGREAAFWLNAEVPGMIAHAAADYEAPFIHVSTDYVFAGDKKEGYIETDEAHPISVYGESKLLGEQHVLAAHPGAFIVRTSRLYGEPAASANAKRSFVEVIVNELQTKPVLEVNDFEYSAPTSVADLAQHTEHYLLQDRPEPGIYHMANSGGVTWLGWAQEIRDQLGLKNEIFPRNPATVQRPAKRPAYSTLLSTRIPPMRSWQEALHDYLSVWQH